MLGPLAIGGIALMVLYSIQAEIRFGHRARSSERGADDRGSTLALSFSSVVPILGLVLAVQARNPTGPLRIPHRMLLALPPVVSWSGVAAGYLGLALRMWAVLTLRERYTRTLLVHERHTIERGGPYRWVRHPGYLGSLLCLNGIAFASGSGLVTAASLAATLAAYAYRVRVEDRMLVAAFGAEYERYRREVGALLPKP